MPNALSTSGSVKEDMYDKYAPRLFGILLNITKNKLQAEEILSNSFIAYFANTLILNNDKEVFAGLLKTSLKTTAATLNLSGRQISEVIFSHARVKEKIFQ
jgi:hypothetical protein